MLGAELEINFVLQKIDERKQTEAVYQLAVMLQKLDARTGALGPEAAALQLQGDL